MNDIQKRFVLFLLLCIPTRLFFVYYAKNTNTQLLKKIGYIALLPAIGFMYIYLTGSRKIGAETLKDSLWQDSHPAWLKCSIHYEFGNN